MRSTDLQTGPPRHDSLTPDDPLIYTTVRRVRQTTHTYQDTRIYIRIHMYESTNLYSIFNLDIHRHTHTLNLTDNIRVSHTDTHTHTHTHMNTFCIIIAIIEVIKYKVIFFNVLVFCQISRALCKFVLYYCGTNTRSFTFRGISGNSIPPHTHTHTHTYIYIYISSYRAAGTDFPNSLSPFVSIVHSFRKVF